MNIKEKLSARHWFAHIFLLIPTTLFFYIFFLLSLNLNRGFDITDESFYILCSRDPRDILASITQFGHYTGILYSFANKNLAGFRLLGLLLLLITAGLFSNSLERYWRHLTEATVSNHSRWLSMSVILSGAVAYYRYWLLTPSYNWLALVSIFLVATGLLNAAVVADNKNTNPSDMFSLFGFGLLVGIGGGLSFMAKPTTAAILAFIFLYFIAATSLHCRWKVFVISSVLSSAIFIFIHSIIFEKGLVSLYVKLRDGWELGKRLEGGHTIANICLQAYSDLKQIPNRLVHDTGLAFLLLFFAVILTQYKKFKYKEMLYLFNVVLVFISVVAWIMLWKKGYWVGGTFVGKRIGFGGLAFSLVLFFSGLSILLICKNNKLIGKGYNKIRFRELLILYIFLHLLAVSFAFGSGNGLIRQMSGAFVFLSGASLYSAFWVDQYVAKKYLGITVSLLLVLSVCLVMTLAYNNPYRLPIGINKQIEPVTFIGNKRSIFVDKKTAKYVNDLKRIALESGWKQGMPLIDLTGGSPGALVILDGKLLGVPWLFGGYTGSNDFARTVLSMVSSSKLRAAWVLTAPSGSIRNSSNILSHIGLEFPNAYETVGKLRTGYRNEDQVLWHPLDSIIAGS